jgi:hypothetical protein
MNTLEEIAGELDVDSRGPAETTPFSVRLAERRLGQARLVTRPERRAHLRRSASDLDWIEAARLRHRSGVTLVDLSEAGALFDIDSPLRPGAILTLEISGAGIAATVPLEVLRCAVARIKGELTTYRAAGAFGHLLQLPAPGAGSAQRLAEFAGADAVLAYLLERSAQAGKDGRTESLVTLERAQILHVLESLKTRARSAGTGAPGLVQLLDAVLPALRRGAPGQIAATALEHRLRDLPDAARTSLRPTHAQLLSLIERCVPPSEPVEARTDGASIAAPEADAAPKTAFQKMVVRFLDGTILKGYSQDFHPSRALFSLWPTIDARPADRVIVPMQKLKAVFFVRDFNGNANYIERRTFTEAAHGRRIEVTFHDNEVVAGTTLNYRPDAGGFFVNPTDPASNNTRIFVLAGAVRRVRFPPAARDTGRTVTRR